MDDCCVYILRPFSAGLCRIFFRDMTGLYWPGGRGEGGGEELSPPSLALQLKLTFSRLLG